MRSNHKLFTICIGNDNRLSLSAIAAARAMKAMPSRNCNKSSTFIVLFQMRVLLFVFLLVSFCGDAQKSARGKYLSIDPFSVSYIRLKTRDRLVWYTNGCTDPGTNVHGKWIQNGDTVVLVLQSNCTTFLLIDKRLCYLPDNGQAQWICGIRRTSIQTKWRVCFQAKYFRKWRRR